MPTKKGIQKEIALKARVTMAASSSFKPSEVSESVITPPITPMPEGVGERMVKMYPMANPQTTTPTSTGISKAKNSSPSKGSAGACCSTQTHRKDQLLVIFLNDLCASVNFIHKFDHVIFIKTKLEVQKTREPVQLLEYPDKNAL